MELFEGIDRVSVERNGDPTSSHYKYGYSYTVTFWGRYGTEGIPQLVVGSIVSTSWTGASKAAISWSTHVETFRQAEYLGDFSSRHMANENDDVQVRMKAINSKGISSP